MIENWGDSGEIDLLEFFAELTIYTSTSCLIGTKFRNQLDSRFANYYHLLERGTDPLCYVDPYMPSRASGFATRPALGWSTWCRA
jgi:sterol 14-demethylase